MLDFRTGQVQRLTFIVAGVQKAGTTALNYYLKRHPRIVLPVKKELHFFDNDELFAAEKVSYESLHKMFRSGRRSMIAGENTPNYLYARSAMARIRDYNPAIKLIAILRNPIERAFSQWNMQRQRGIEPLDFLEAIEAEPKRLRERSAESARKVAYIDRGRYAEQLTRAFAFFPPEQILLLKYEEFRACQREAVDSVFQFLGLHPPRFRPIEAHDIAYQRHIRPEERAVVLEILREDIGRVQAMLDWNCANWR